MFRRGLVAIMVSIILLSGCGTAAGSGDGTLQALNAWVRLPAPMSAGSMTQPTAVGSMSADHSTHMSGTDSDAPGGNTAAYLVLQNDSGADDTLVSVASDVAAAVELHTVEMADGVMKMRPVEGGIPLPAGTGTELKPGGYHVMLIDLQRELAEGDSVELTLTTASGATISVNAEVRKP